MIDDSNVQDFSESSSVRMERELLVEENDSDNIGRSERQNEEEEEDSSSLYDESSS